MDIVDAIKLVARRWIVFLLVLAVGAAASVLYVKGRPPVFKTVTNVAFVQAVPQGRAAAHPTANPLSPTDVSLIVHDILASPTSQQEVASRGGLSYKVSDPTTNNSPIETITTSAPDSASALSTARSVVDIAVAEARSKQSQQGIPSASQVEVVVVTGPGPALRQTAGKVRAGAALGALCLVLAVMAAFLAESIAVRRAEKRLARAAAATEPPPGPADALDSEELSGVVVAMTASQPEVAAASDGQWVPPWQNPWADSSLRTGGA